jgi:hypothetical protein
MCEGCDVDCKRVDGGGGGKERERGKEGKREKRAMKRFLSICAFLCGFRYNLALYHTPTRATMTLKWSRQEEKKKKEGKKKE